MPTILAIDDKKDNLVSVAAILKETISDCEVLTALSGPDGIDQARESRPDVVLLDIKMPGMDGYEVCERLKADPLTNPIPILLLTAARTDAESRIRGLDAGADTFLSKPIDAAELAAQVKVALRIKRSEDALREEQSKLEERVRERTVELEQAYAELSRKEKHLRDSEQFLRTSLDSLSASIAIIDESGKVVHINQAWREFAEENGAPHLADFEGHNYLDVCDTAEGPDAHIAHDFAAAVRDVLAGRRQSFQIEYPCHGPKEKRWFIARVTRFAGAQPRAVIAHENISEQKRAEERLLDSEARYRAVFDNAQDAICVLDADGRFLEANSAATRMYGYEHDEFLRLNVRDLLREDYIPIFEDFRRQISQSGAFRGSTVDRRKDGTEIDVEVTGARFFYRGEQRLLAVVRDVTEWHRALRELEDHNREMEQILAAFPDAFIFTDTRRRILRVNPAFTRVFGYEPEEVLGKQTRILYASEADFEEQGQLRYNEGAPERYEPYEVVYRRRDGAEFPSETIGTTVHDARGNLIGMVGLVRDIAERKRAEIELRKSREKLIEAQYLGKMGDYSWDLASGRVTWSEGMYRLMKYEQDADLHIENLAAHMFHPEDRDRIRRWLEEGIASGKESLPVNEYRLICGDGEVLYVQARAFVEHRDGKPVRVFGVVQDISERARAQAELRLKSNALENSLNGFIIVDEHELIVYVNQAFLDIWGYDSKEELVGKSPVCLWTDPAMHDEIIANLKEHGRFNPRYLARRKDGSTFWMSMYTRIDEDEEGRTIYFGTCIDITPRVVAAERQTLYADILATLNRSNEWKTLIGDLLGQIKEFTRFDSIGIRLRRDGDYPYFAFNGFTEDFVEAETSLCRFDKDGGFVLDPDGEVHLHCLCGDVIRGRTDPEKPWFTEGGSFWTNDIDALAGRDDAPEFVDIARSQCLAHGYSSLALIPLRAGDETIGLLQFNVAAPDAFTENLIAFFEQIGVSIGIAFTRKRIQESLQESESKLREAQRMARLGHWYWDVNTGDVDWSDEVYRIFHLDPNEFTPHIEAIQALSPWPEDHQRDSELIEKAKRSREPGTFEQRFLRPDGSTAHYYSTFQGIYDESGELTAIKGTVQDVTERREAEEALRESEALLNDTGMIARIAGWRHDLRTRKAVWTEALYDIVGIESGPPPGPDEHWDYYPEEERKKLEAVYNRAIETGEPFDIELQWYDQKDDGLLWCRVIGKPVFEDGECVGLKGTFQDITDRKRAEEAIIESEKKYRLLADNTVDCIWTADLDTVFTYVNPAIEHTLGFTPEEWIGSTVADHSDERNLGIMKRMIDETLRALPALDPATFEAEMLHKDGHPVPLEMIGRVLVDEEGAPVALLGTVRDVTKRKLAEQALVESERRFRSLVRVAPTGIGVLVDRVFKQVNRKVCQMTGYSERELLERDARLLYPSDEDYEYVGREKYEQIRDNGTGTVETRWRRKDGRVIDILLSSTPLDPDDLSKGVTFTALDISERNRAREELTATKRMLEAAIAQSPAGILIADAPDVRIRLANQAAYDIRGGSAAELAGIPMEEHAERWQAYRPDGTPYPPEELPLSRAVLRGDVTRNLELIVRDENGEDHWVSCNAAPIRDDAGEITAGIVILLDVTERKRAEAAAEAQRDRLFAVLQRIPGLVYLQRRDYTIAFANDRLREEFGEPGNGPCYESFWGREEPCEPCPTFRVFQTGSPQTWECTVPTGKTYVVYDEPFPAVGDDEPMVLEMLIDITDRKLNESLVRMNVDTLERLTRKLSLKEILEPLIEQIDSLLPGNRSAINLRSVDGEFLHFLVGPHLPEDWVRRTDPVKIHPKAGSCGAAAFHNRRVIVDDIATDPLWKAVRDEALSHGFAACWSEPLRDDTGEVLGTLAMYLKEARGPNDRELRVLEGLSGLISLVIQSVHREEALSGYREHLEELVEERTEEIARRSAELEAANAELEAFSYSVSHDLRAPLRRMDGFSRTVYDGYGEIVDERGRHFLQRICANAKHMGDLIDDLLKLSRVSRGEMTYERVDLGAIAKKISLELKSSEPDRNVEFEIEADTIVRGDARLLEAVLQNLLANAWKFTGKTEHARIEFGSSTNARCEVPNRELPDDARVYFVRDNGAGFDMAFAEKLFGPFQRLHRTDEFEGSGIGLATVQRIIRRHGGIVWAQGAVGEGAAFYFSLTPTRNKEEQ